MLLALQMNAWLHAWVHFVTQTKRVVALWGFMIMVPDYGSCALCKPADSKAQPIGMSKQTPHSWGDSFGSAMNAEAYAAPYNLQFSG